MIPQGMADFRHPFFGRLRYLKNPIRLDKILINTGDSSVTKDEDIRNFRNLDVLGTEGSKKQFIILVEKGREGWNCRSLLGIALFRSPKSKIFVLQATMRCLRQLTDEQLKATVFLSRENYDILEEELRKNYNMEISEMGKTSKKEKRDYKVRVLPPPRKLKVKRVWHEYDIISKDYTDPISFGLSDIDLSKYDVIELQKSSLRIDTTAKETVRNDLKDNMKFSLFSLTAEIAKYLNISCILVSKILNEAYDGAEEILAAVNDYNEVIHDILIPKIFNALYEVKCTVHSEDKEIFLLHEPKDKGYYEYKGLPDLTILKDDKSFNASEVEKSFHADTYIFDSKPERECFLQYIQSPKVKKVYFTGMFTANQGDLSIPYYDPESMRLRHYYPDFFAEMSDGTYRLIEVKADNMVDDVVVKAKQSAAEEMAIASHYEYIMYKGNDILKTNILEQKNNATKVAMDQNQ